MKTKHILIRIDQCLTLATASNCHRAKYGAMLLDPERNVVLMDGYNGAPRGGGTLCGGCWCHRDGLKASDIEMRKVRTGNEEGWFLSHQAGSIFGQDARLGGPFKTRAKAATAIPTLLEKYSPQHTDRAEVGCHHAEMNVICNAAARGTPCANAWLLVTGEPCLLCAKLIHHAGIAKVIVIQDGYAHAEGMRYLELHHVEVEHLTMDQVRQMGREIREARRP